MAVIGSGPSGRRLPTSSTNAATVTVYERSDRIGSLLMDGIPNMKLEKDIVQRKVKIMEERGVAFPHPELTWEKASNPPSS